MPRRGDLLEDFERLQSCFDDPHRRGLALEDLVARRLRAAHFEVVTNAQGAKPRQTDLIARTDRLTLVVETKWRQAPADIGALDGLTARMGRIAGDATGVLISVSGFSGSVVTQVEQRRDEAVLLLDEPDLKNFFVAHTDVRGLLLRKRDALLLHGRVLVSDQEHDRPYRRSAPAGEAVRGDAFLVAPDGSKPPWIAAKGGFGDYAFARELRDPDWVPASGVGVNLDLALPLETAADSVKAIGELSDLGWITGAGSWCVQQSSINWHGTGADTLVAAIDGWLERYEALASAHHREQLVYQDVCEDGFYVLSLDLSVSDRRRVGHASLSIQLAGVPLDPVAIKELCRTFDIESPYFRPRSERSLQTVGLRDLGSVEPVAMLVEEDETDPLAREWVVGVVVRNPLFGGGDRLREDLPWALSQTEVLICALGNHHPLDAAPNEYALRRVEWAWTSESVVARVSADWED